MESKCESCMTESSLGRTEAVGKDRSNQADHVLEDQGGQSSPEEERCQTSVARE